MTGPSDISMTLGGLEADLMIKHGDCPGINTAL